MRLDTWDWHCWISHNQYPSCVPRKNCELSCRRGTYPGLQCVLHLQMPGSIFIQEISSCWGLDLSVTHMCLNWAFSQNYPVGHRRSHCDLAVTVTCCQPLLIRLWPLLHRAPLQEKGSDRASPPKLWLMALSILLKPHLELLWTFKILASLSPCWYGKGKKWNQSLNLIRT